CPLLGLRLSLRGNGLESLDLGQSAVSLGLEGDLRLAYPLRLAQQLPGVLELGRKPVAFLDDTAQLGRGAFAHVGEDVLESLDLGAQLVALLDGGSGQSEP